MQNSSLFGVSLCSAVAAVAVAGSANADYVFQTFSGSGSVSANASRATPDGSIDSLSLGYNAIAGGASSMEVEVVASAFGDTNAATPATTAANHGTYGTGFAQSGNYYKYYYGGNSGSSSAFSANDNYRAWSTSSSSTANLSGSALNFSSSAQWDSGIADITRLRYTSNTYSTLYTGSTQASVTLRADAYTMGTETDSNLIYSAAAGQVMDLSASTGLTAIRLEGSGIAAANGGSVGFYMSDSSGTMAYVIRSLSSNEVLGDMSVSVADLLGAFPTLDLTQITRFSISLWSTSQFADEGRNVLGNNNGFSYNASQVTLVGYAVPAPGAAALVGAAGLITVRRRKA